MARGKLTIRDVPAAIRAKGAAEARKRLQQTLSDPHLSLAQRQEIHKKLQWAAEWEAGPDPVNHVVTVSESISVDEKV